MKRLEETNLPADSYNESTIYRLEKIIKYEEEHIQKSNSLKELIISLNNVESKNNLSCTYLKKINYVEEKMNENYSIMKSVKESKNCFPNEQSFDYTLECLIDYENYLYDLEGILISISNDNLFQGKNSKELFENRWTLYKLGKNENKFKDYKWIAEFGNKTSLVYKDEKFYICNKNNSGTNPEGLYEIDSIDMLNNLISSAIIVDEKKYKECIKNFEKETLIKTRKNLVKYNKLIKEIKAYEQEKTSIDREFNINYYTEIVVENNFELVNKLININNNELEKYSNTEFNFLGKKEKEEIINQIIKYLNYLNNLKELMNISYYLNGIDEEFDINLFINRWNEEQNRQNKKGMI